MRVTRWAPLVLVILIVVAGLPADAQPPGRFGAMSSPSGSGPMMFPLLLRGANLTPEQETRVRQITGSRRTATRQLTEQLRQAEDALVDRLFASGGAQIADVQREVERINQVRNQLL